MKVKSYNQNRGHAAAYKTAVWPLLHKQNIQVEQSRDLARDSDQRKLTYSLQNHPAYWVSVNC